jgi:rhodanese-related sulfurtransferase
VSQRIERPEVQRLIEQGAQVVEVLPRAEYDYEHIAGAVNIPLRELDKRAGAELDRSRPVIVYCHDYLCDMSPRAALRLTQLGFGQTYDYVPGKVDWMAAGLPREGQSAQIPQPGDIARRDVPSCQYSDPARDVVQHMRGEGSNFCVAVDTHKVVLGMIYLDEQNQASDDVPAERIMHPGPTTVRANEPLQPLMERMTRADVDGILVTDPEGRLIGLLDWADADADADADAETALRRT